MYDVIFRSYTLSEPPKERLKIIFSFCDTVFIEQYSISFGLLAGLSLIGVFRAGGIGEGSSLEERLLI